MPTWQSDFVETNGIRLHVTRTGGGGPPIVLSHGFADDGLCWTPIAQALEADYDVIMLDARYHGRSDAPEQASDRAAMAEDLAGAVSGLGLQAPVLWGHSMGAVSTLMAAARHPELPRAIVLEDPPPLWAATEPRDNAGWLAHNRAWIAALQKQTREEIAAAKHAESPGWPLLELGPWADSKLRVNPSYFNQMGSSALDRQTVLPRITCPVLLVTGDPERGAIVTGEQAGALPAMLPAARVHIAHIAGAGHNIRRDQFEAYLAAIVPQLADWTAEANRVHG